MEFRVWWVMRVLEAVLFTFMEQEELCTPMDEVGVLDTLVEEALYKSMVVEEEL